ncbi:M15 family metallopeptidase [Demequina litorisediminis]|uniref:D-alanyl-D-alanine carboxypeptidase-like core domain-containing protein n=1 Tax=Demequina litorisediminis TaxID=1849022 RepID=A0ABQ6ID68_9MICO|nr:M15 family metallopeptidase [Demequina litorisediminis]GMA35621.1 hypothetical protein GCM10025876_18250 [Demequina litorisediminis]
MDGISAIQQRIGEISATIASLQPTTQATSSVTSTASLTGLFSTGATTATATDAGSFSAALASALSGATTVTTLDTTMTADGIPAALASYGNGLIPESALATIPGSSERMWAPAAEAAGRMIGDAAAAGVTIGVTDGYRDYDSQVQVAAEKGLYRKGGLAAVPGTSQHGWGLAVDLRLDATAQAWMREHAGAYGFTEAVAREPWHWEYAPPTS